MIQNVFVVFPGNRVLILCYTIKLSHMFIHTCYIHRYRSNNVWIQVHTRIHYIPHIYIYNYDTSVPMWRSPIWKYTYSKTGSKQNNNIIITHLYIWKEIETIELWNIQQTRKCAYGKREINILKEAMYRHIWYQHVNNILVGYTMYLIVILIIITLYISRVINEGVKGVIISCTANV